MIPFLISEGCQATSIVLIKVGMYSDGVMLCKMSVSQISLFTIVLIFGLRKIWDILQSSSETKLVRRLSISVGSSLVSAHLVSAGGLKLHVWMSSHINRSLTESKLTFALTDSFRWPFALASD